MFIMIWSISVSKLEMNQMSVNHSVERNVLVCSHGELHSEAKG